MRYTLILMVTLLMSGLAGCGGESTDEPEQTQVTPEQQKEADAGLARTVARRMVGTFQRNLKSELLAAIGDGNFVHAVEVCQTIAPALADSMAAPGWSIRRVSNKFRNTKNRATLAEMSIMSEFAGPKDSIPGYVERWTDVDGRSLYHYYEPIRTMPLCLNCHGDLQTLADGVMQQLKKSYPLDRAVGYKNDQLRGMFVVEAYWDQGESFARKIAVDSI